MTKAFRVLLWLAMLLIGSLSASPTLAQTPAKEGFVDAGSGVKLYYRVVGTGRELVVLINGGPGFTSDYLADDLLPMARQHSLLIYDQRGIGRSTLVSDSTALAAQRYAEDLEAIRKHLGLEQLTLLGHSWGVVPATLYAMQHAGRVRRLILVGTIPAQKTGLDRAFETMAAARDSATLRRMAELRRIRASNPADLAACREYYRLWFTPFFGARDAASRMKGNVCAGSPESLKNKPNVDKFTFASLGNWDWTASLSGVRVPTLIIQGELDPLSIEGARRWAAAMPNARLLELKGVGHFPHVETPDVFFAAVNRFLNGDWPEGASSRVLRDTDGNSYSVKVMADGRAWTTSNLRLATPGSYCHGDDASLCLRFGRLYSWTSAVQACAQLGPGWRLPTDDEWRTLANAYGGLVVDAERAVPNELRAGRTSGFNALLGGNRDVGGGYARLDAHGIYWTATESDSEHAWMYNFGRLGLSRHQGGDKSMAASVRCAEER